MKKAIVIDGNSLIYRAFHATYKQAEWAIANNLTPHNATKTVGMMIFNILNKNNYDYGLIALDSSKKTLRAQEYEEYKANRKPMDEKLVVQLEPIREMFAYMGFEIIAQEGIEADDFVGSFAKMMNQNNIQVEIYSSDRDMLQLVNQQTKLMLIKQGNNIQEVHLSNFADLNDGLAPSQIPDYKALVGDTSDNLIGIKGIGPKTAAKILLEYKTLENIYASIDSFAPSTKNKIDGTYEMTQKTKRLATIDVNLMLDHQPQQYFKKPYDIKKLDEFFEKHKINNMQKYYKE